MIEMLGFGLLINAFMFVIFIGHGIIDSIFRTRDTIYWLDKAKPLAASGNSLARKLQVFIPYYYAYKIFSLYAHYGIQCDFLIVLMIYNNLNDKNNKGE